MGLYLRWKDQDIPDVVEFLTDEWATALFHDRFMDFCHQIKLEMSAQEEVKEIINTALEGVDKKSGLSRALLKKIREQLPKESVKQMQDHLMEYCERIPIISRHIFSLRTGTQSDWLSQSL